MLYNIADHIYIGYMSGDGSLELVDVGVCMPLIMIISAFEVLIRSVGAPKVSIYISIWARAIRKRLKRSSAIAFTLRFVISAILTPFCCLERGAAFDVRRKQ